MKVIISIAISNRIAKEFFSWVYINFYQYLEAVAVSHYDEALVVDFK